MIPYISRSSKSWLESLVSGDVARVPDIEDLATVLAEDGGRRLTPPNVSTADQRRVEALLAVKLEPTGRVRDPQSPVLESLRQGRAMLRDERTASLTLPALEPGLLCAYVDIAVDPRAWSPKYAAYAFAIQVLEVPNRAPRKCSSMLYNPPRVRLTNFGRTGTSKLSTCATHS